MIWRGRNAASPEYSLIYLFWSESVQYVQGRSPKDSVNVFRMKSDDQVLRQVSYLLRLIKGVLK